MCSRKVSRRRSIVLHPQLRPSPVIPQHGAPIVRMRVRRWTLAMLHTMAIPSILCGIMHAGPSRTLSRFVTVAQLRLSRWYPCEVLSYLAF